MAEQQSAGRWRVDPSRRLTHAGGGLPAFIATNPREQAGALIAVQIAPAAPARAAAITALSTAHQLSHVLIPLGVATAPAPDSVPAGFVICPAPPGPALAADLAPWPEQALIERVLKPLALALEGLRLLGVTHRAIRPGNVFAAPGGPATLGCAWAAPPASGQSALYEPPGSACCAPAARGDGRSADDIYALGVLRIVLALGREPLAGLPAEEIIRRKLALGSHAALTENARLPASLMELTRGMLAEDPEHRPAPSLLRDPVAARTRRVATRPPRRAHTPITLGGQQIWHLPELALACARHPEEATGRLRAGEIDAWVRRGLGDSALAVRLDEVGRQRTADRGADPVTADALMLMRAVAVLDPLAPLCWRGTLLWPDALGAMLADGAAEAVLADLVLQEAVAAWGAMRDGRSDTTLLRIEGQQHRAVLRGADLRLAVRRLCYLLNPRLPCASPLLRPDWVASAADLLPVLERAMAAPSPPSVPWDRDLLAFIAARLDLGPDDMVRLEQAGGGTPEPAFALTLLALFARLQDRGGPPSLPALAASLARLVRPLIEAWPNLRRRAEAEVALADLAGAGQLARLHALLDNPRLAAADTTRLRQVRQAVRQLDHGIGQLAAAAPARAARAGRLGRVTASCLGAASLAAAVARAVF